MTDPITKQDDPRLLKAAEVADWGQVIANGGPPCFNLEDGKFCLRAKRWAGHEHHHDYVSLRDLLAALKQRAAEARE